MNPRVMPEFMFKCALGRHHPRVLGDLLLGKLLLAEAAAIVVRSSASPGQTCAVGWRVESLWFLENERFFRC